MNEDLTWGQRYYKWRLSDTRFKEMQEYTHSWKATCPKCENVFSYWDSGGAIKPSAIFYGGSMQIEQGGFYRCPSCKKWSTMTFSRSQ